MFNTFLRQSKSVSFLNTLSLFFPQQAGALPVSPFTHYKGELVISLKFITPKQPAAPIKKGKTLQLWQRLMHFGVHC